MRLVDLEEFKEHSYPDVLVSVLIKTLSEFKIWLDTGAIAPASRRSFWQKFSSLNPLSRKIATSSASDLSKELQLEINHLNQLLFAPEEYEREQTNKYSEKSKINAEVGVKTEIYGLGINSKLKSEMGDENSRELKDHYKSTKNTSTSEKYYKI